MNFRILGDFPAKIKVLNRKFQGMSIIQDTAKIKNANFEGAKIEVKVYIVFLWPCCGRSKNELKSAYQI